MDLYKILGSPGQRAYDASEGRATVVLDAAASSRAMLIASGIPLPAT